MAPVLRRREHRSGEVQCCVAQGGQGNGAAAILLGQGRPRILRRLKHGQPRRRTDDIMMKAKQDQRGLLSWPIRSSNNVFKRGRRMSDMSASRMPQAHSLTDDLRLRQILRCRA